MSATSLDELFPQSHGFATAASESQAITEPDHSYEGLPRLSGTSVEASVGSYADERRAALDAFERAYVKAVLASTGGNVSAAARIAKIDRVYLHRLMRRHHTTRASLAPAAE